MLFVPPSPTGLISHSSLFLSLLHPTWSCYSTFRLHLLMIPLTFPGFCGYSMLDSHIWRFGFRCCRGRVVFGFLGLGYLPHYKLFLVPFVYRNFQHSFLLRADINPTVYGLHIFIIYSLVDGISWSRLSHPGYFSVLAVVNTTTRTIDENNSLQ